jgi:hypothetical protein
MAVHDRAELEREGRVVRRETRASLMSDTKWRKVLAVLKAHPELGVQQYFVKFVGEAEEREVGWVGLYPPRPWIDTFAFGPVPLRSIEWMLFPRLAVLRNVDRTIPAKTQPQQVEILAELIAGLGKLPIEWIDRGLLVRGYLPR